mmetsp:Transcript_9227/g.14971  ORF Transcript_9227/g.14971 Transcript_9227/m.14971 type:complete len:203 (-) Transcript_9227:565-1173(-)
MIHDIVFNLHQMRLHRLDVSFDISPHILPSSVFTLFSPASLQLAFLQHLTLKPFNFSPHTQHCRLCVLLFFHLLLTPRLSRYHRGRQTRAQQNRRRPPYIHATSMCQAQRSLHVMLDMLRLIDHGALRLVHNDQVCHLHNASLQALQIIARCRSDHQYEHIHTVCHLDLRLADTHCLHKNGVISSSLAQCAHFIRGIGDASQ